MSAGPANGSIRKEGHELSMELVEDFLEKVSEWGDKEWVKFDKAAFDAILGKQMANVLSGDSLSTGMKAAKRPRSSSEFDFSYAVEALTEHRFPKTYYLHGFIYDTMTIISQRISKVVPEEYSRRSPYVLECAAKCFLYIPFGACGYRDRSGKWVEDPFYSIVLAPVRAVDPTIGVIS